MKLLDGKDSAYFSYKLATIEKNIPMDIDINDLKESLDMLVEEGFIKLK